MKKIGIICEYNPFHNGHLYHINKIKEKYPNSMLILVLNGYFLQRGEISIISKEDKTRISLNHNIDLIVELPFIFGTQSADIFAEKSIQILNHLKCDLIIFGSESNDDDTLLNTAKQQLENPDYDEAVKIYLKEGLNYPTAMAKALNLENFKFLPNDLLGISYVKAILKNNFNIQFETIKRTNDYKDLEDTNEIVSASNIREKIKQNIDIQKYIPSNVGNKILNVNYNYYFNLLKYKINTCKSLENYLDVDEGIENRLKKFINTSNNLNEFIENIKTKRYTYNKINRMLIHILLDFKKEDNTKKLEYIHVLGFNQIGKNYINKIKKDINISLIPIKNSLTYKYEINASIIFDLINKTNTLSFEKLNMPIIKQ